MKEVKKLSTSEKEIMHAIWENKKSLCVNDVFALLENSDWKYTTVATFLSRLTKKGFLKCHKKGTQNYYDENISREEYLSQQTNEFMKDMYDNSARDFIASICKERISEDDYKELMSILKKYEKN